MKNWSPRLLFGGGKSLGLSVLSALEKQGTLPSLIASPHTLSRKDGLDVRQWATDRNLPYMSSNRLTELSHDEISQFDLLILATFEIVGASVFNAPTLGGVNVHPSLLPKYRGVHPISWALINGETETGVTVHQINSNIDEGGVFRQGAIEIEDEDDIWSLTNKLDLLAAELVCGLVTHVDEQGSLPDCIPQTGYATKAPRRRPEDGRILWTTTARSIFNLVRALRPPLPLAHFFNSGGHEIGVSTCEVSDKLYTAAAPGIIVDIVGSNCITVMAADGAVDLTVERSEDFVIDMQLL